MKKHQPSQPIVFQRADPAALAGFDPRTKCCTMNCGPHRDDPRTATERQFLCEDCLPGAPNMSATLTVQAKQESIVSIWKTVEGENFTKDVCLVPCPHCLGQDALIVSDVEVDGRAPERYPQAVHCGGCGARGPWSKTEEGAADAWNKTAGIATVSITEWRHAPHCEPGDHDDFPF
jgi:hypothetical protein